MPSRATLSPADDEFHDPPSADPTWAETAWFAAQNSERKLGVWLYPLFRRSLGIMSCHIWVWNSEGRELWQQPYYRHYWHMPIPDGIQLSDFELTNGLGYKAINPLRDYDLRYSDGDAFKLELEYRAIHPPHELGITAEHGHIDQLGRVRGEIELAGERIAIDCIEMRDRTWSPRRERRDRAELYYSYGAVSDKQAFHCAVRRSARSGEMSLLGGFTLNDGTMRNLVRGTRRVERDSEGRPARVVVEGSDDAGNEVQARGVVESQMAIHTSPYFVWVSQMRWTLPDGSEAWGEDQETWSPGALRAMRTSS